MQMSPLNITFWDYHVYTRAIYSIYPPTCALHCAEIQVMLLLCQFGGAERLQKQAEVLTPSDERGLAVYRSCNMIGQGKEALPLRLGLGIMNDWQEKEKLPVDGRGAGLMAAAELRGSLDHGGPLHFHLRPQPCQEKLLFLPSSFFLSPS